MKYLLILTCLLFSAANSFATDRTIHIEWGYTPPSAPAVTGYVLYQEGVKICTFPGPTTTSGDCTVDLVKQSTTFTLTAAFNDNTESPHSAPFTFIFDGFNKGPPTNFFLVQEIPAYSTVTFKLDMFNTADISEYIFNINDVEVCRTNNLAVTEFTCKVPVITGKKSFSVLALLTNGEISNRSNTITYIP